MLEAGTLRIVTFEAWVHEPVMDAALRDEIVPELCRQPGIRHCFAARRGVAGQEVRIIASHWAAESPARESPEERLISQASRDARPIQERARTEVLPIAVAARFERSDPLRILRVFRGHVTPDEMDPYLVEARTGMLADAAANDGLGAFYLGTRTPDDFVTVSAWTSWSAIELSTGGDVRRPFVTRNSARLARYEVAHFEIVAEGGEPGPFTTDPPTSSNS
jgi:hypothetical protein